MNNSFLLPRHHPVLAGTLCRIHRLIRPLGDAGLRVVWPEIGDAGAEGDQYFFVVVQKDAFGEFTLQAHDRFFGVQVWCVGQDDDEFFTAKAGESVLWPERIANDGYQMDKRGVTGIMAE